MSQAIRPFRASRWNRGGRSWRRSGSQWRGRGRNNLFGSDVMVGYSQTNKLPSATITEDSIPGWSLYFPQEKYNDQHLASKLLSAFSYFIERASSSGQINLKDAEKRGSFIINYCSISGDEELLISVPNLKELLDEQPEVVLYILGLSAYGWLASTKTLDEPSPSLVLARLVNLPTITPLKQLKALLYGKLIAIRGTVIRVSNIQPVCTEMAFRCNVCRAQQVMRLDEGRFVQPTKCAERGCSGRTFEALRDSWDTRYVDSQTIRLQELLADEQRDILADGGRVPRTLDCQLTHDLVDVCVPGDVITMVGVVCIRNQEAVGGGMRATRKDRCLFSIYVHANSLCKEGCSGVEPGLDLVDVSSACDMYAIKAIHEEPNLFRLLVHSFCPNIYGHESVKAGLLLCLLGGCQRHADSGQRIPIRGDPHVLVVGDPGLGKSQMLRAAASIAPRSVYVCGNTTTAAGLTVTVARETGSAGYSLEAGALVLADRGCCCIDEFDKMSSQHQALLEAMEQQSVSVAKAGIVCSLPTRCSILAAANPVGGHYNRSRTVGENLKLSGPLLSRFDLVFIMVDKPNEEMDSMLSEHVIRLHSTRQSCAASVESSPCSTNGTPTFASNQSAQQSLGEKLRRIRGEQFDLIPHQLLRKYVAYARRFVRPRLSPEAASVLRNFYLDLRRTYHTRDAVPITTRQLESLVRLTEARARAELREIAHAEDAWDVVQLMRESMLDVTSDDTGMVDFSRSQMGASGMGRGSVAKRLVAALEIAAQLRSSALFSSSDISQVAREAQIPTDKLDSVVATLNTQGYLLQKGARSFQLLTSNF